MSWIEELRNATWLGPVGDVLSILGFCISVWSLFNSRRAKKAVENYSRKITIQDARDKARDLKTLLDRAVEAALAQRWRRNANSNSSRGRVLRDDVNTLQCAQHALKTMVTSDSQRKLKIDAAADEIDRALKNIIEKLGRDGWSDALHALQGVIPAIEEIVTDLSKEVTR